jgi:hypothetical protein
MHSRVVCFPSHPACVPIFEHLFHRLSLALDLQDIPPPSTWLGLTSTLCFSKVSWRTVLPPAVN